MNGDTDTDIPGDEVPEEKAPIAAVYLFRMTFRYRPFVEAPVPTVKELAAWIEEIATAGFLFDVTARGERVDK